MTRENLNRALIDLGWVSLIHRVLGGKPSATYALHHLMLRAGRPQTYDQLAEGYAEFVDGNGAMTPGRRGHVESNSKLGVQKRIERARAALADIGVDDAITTLPEVGYVMEKADRARVEAALLEACGFELEAA